MLNKKFAPEFLQLLNIDLNLDNKIVDGYCLPKIGALPTLQLNPNSWQQASLIANRLNYRLVTIWAQDLINNFELNIILELQNSYLQLRTLITANNPTIPSFTPCFPAANRLERHTHDMFGIIFSGHPDPRRWTRHLAWDVHQFPLRKNFSSSAPLKTKTPPDTNYPFLPITGTGSCEIPVGPVHAGIIEPGHFRFQIGGEDIFKLEERLGYTHKGIEKIAEGRTIYELIKIAGRVSGDSTAAHAWAACAALENSTDLELPERALYIRAIICERERIANHLGDFAGICNDVAYTFAYYQLTRLKELWLRLNSQIFNHRFMMDCITPGGVTVDLLPVNCQALHEQNKNFKEELAELLPIFEEHSGLHNRVKTTGILTVEQASRLGVLGYVGRASGQKFDLRHDLPYPPYDKLKINVPVYKTGDVLARLRVRFQEILVALDIIEQLLNTLPPGTIHTTWLPPNKTVEGIGLVEGWRGEIITFVRINSSGLIERYFPRDPSWFSWPALEQLVHHNIVPDFPVCNKSINGSYSGVDL